MRTKTLHNAKLIIKIISNKITNKIVTESVYDNRTQTFWDEERIKERGIQHFLNMNDVKENNDNLQKIIEPNQKESVKIVPNIDKIIEKIEDEDISDDEFFDDFFFDE